MNVGQVDAILRAATSTIPPKATQEQSQKLWPNIKDAVMNSLEARMRERTQGLEKQLEDQKEREIADFRSILDELARNIREELDEEPPPQQEFSFMESKQVELNRGSLEARLKAIPEELRREAEQVRRRYASPKARLFPVAVTFLLPERLARGVR
jgi:hypothetical protein